MITQFAVDEWLSVSPCTSEPKSSDILDTPSCDRMSLGSGSYVPVDMSAGRRPMQRDCDRVPNSHASSQVQDGQGSHKNDFYRGGQVPVHQGSAHESTPTTGGELSLPALSSFGMFRTLDYGNLSNSNMSGSCLPSTRSVLRASDVSEHQHVFADGSASHSIRARNEDGHNHPLGMQSCNNHSSLGACP